MYTGLKMAANAHPMAVRKPACHSLQAKLSPGKGRTPVRAAKSYPDKYPPRAERRERRSRYRELQAGGCMDTGIGGTGYLDKWPINIYI
jgi:hypothetical protein